MRTALIFLSWAFVLSCALAQKQEERFINRLLDGPDKKNANSMGNKQFQDTPDLKLRSSSDEKAKFSEKKAFATEKYATRSFLGINNPWFGNKVFKTKSDQDWAKKALSDSGKAYGVKDASVREYYQAEKAAVTPETPITTRSSTIKGAAQGGVDAAKKNLTIDDVREILNKNR